MKDYPRGTHMQGSWDWLRFAAQLPAKPFQFTSVSAGKLIVAGRYILREITGLNNATVGGTLTVLDGQDATGVICGTQGYAASQQFSHSFSTGGVLTEIGIWLTPGNGTLTGTVLAVPLWEYENTAPGE